MNLIKSHGFTRGDTILLNRNTSLLLGDSSISAFPHQSLGERFKLNLIVVRWVKHFTLGLGHKAPFMSVMMNNSSSTILLQKINDEMAILLIPAMIFIGVLMFTGLIGNITVCYFYGCKTKTSPTSCFILGLGIFDLLSCIISMPMEIVDLRFFYMFPDVTVCKVLTATNFLFALASVLILIAIATERYRRVCFPFRKQFTVFQARLICCSSVPISCLFSWPFLILYTVVPVDIPINDSVNITGYDCTTDHEESSKVYLNALNIMQMLLFIFTLVPLTVLYILVYRQLIKMRKFRHKGPCEDSVTPNSSEIRNSNHSSPTISSTIKDTSNSCDNISTIRASINSLKQSNYSLGPSNAVAQIGRESMDKTKETTFITEDNTEHSQNNHINNEECFNHKAVLQVNMFAKHKKERDSQEINKDDQATLPNHTSGMFNNALPSSDRDRPEFGYSLNKLRFRDTKTVGFTKLMLVITVTFIMSFIPYLCLVVWRSLSTEYVVTKMTDVQRIFYVIGLRSFFLNSAFNPMIYGFFNSKFRNFFAGVCCDFCRTKSRYKHELETTSSPQSKT
ncbi:hypothetical protein CHS0354_039263 [Potamilus streckersoni]|uniref:G-protein coupled receptors family 1 profile domain-containing protein n=1 Tax=Potamilus streckersoni TaxID=2493646 RepID=A0AAE0S3I9_9BIVA|nr:hypothetical protein CHS0354_039263 [Potamilus streckersoni]